MTVVFDTNVVVSAALWPDGEARRCFFIVAKRKLQMAVTAPVMDEYRAVAERVRKRVAAGKNPAPFLDWIAEKSTWHEPAPLGKQRSRDAADDLFLSCALAGGAECFVTNDRDLLVLEKPFGIAMLTPHQFIVRFR